MRTKAAPGKGRELRPKWKNLNWVLESLGVMDSSATLKQKAACKPKKQKGPNSGLLWAFLSSADFPKILANTQKN